MKGRKPRAILPHASAFRHLLLPLVLVGWVAPALADPCTGKLDAPGAAFSGVMHYVGDGYGLCVAPPCRPDRGIEIRLADFFAPELNMSGGRETKRPLEALAQGRPLMCRAGRRSYDRVIAVHARRGSTWQPNARCRNRRKWTWAAMTLELPGLLDASLFPLDDAERAWRSPS